MLLASRVQCVLCHRLGFTCFIVSENSCIIFLLSSQSLCPVRCPSQLQLRSLIENTTQQAGVFNIEIISFYFNQCRFLSPLHIFLLNKWWTVFAVEDRKWKRFTRCRFHRAGSKDGSGKEPSWEETQAGCFYQMVKMGKNTQNDTGW